MNETEPTKNVWIEYFTNRIEILTDHINGLIEKGDINYIKNQTELDFYMNERNQLREEIEKIKKANQECNPN
ncbi:hypothetical protein [Carnobacterium mobile]|uniref:hypothetical protein n=1 Tax=Carnobacterium mobile TaxID=2750 RepID=UPI000557C9E5|nr:hypothetical protein [Carnobacterium mobile]